MCLHFFSIKQLWLFSLMWHRHFLSKMGSSPVYASRSTSEKKGRYSKRTVLWSIWVFTLTSNGAARASEFLLYD